MGSLCSSAEEDYQSEISTGQGQFVFKKTESTALTSTSSPQNIFYDKNEKHELVKGGIKKHNSISSKRTQKEYKNGNVNVVRF
jgi:hypothetical protein